MRRLIFFAALSTACLASTLGAAAAAGAAKPIDNNAWMSVPIVTYPLKPPVQAPADEYFGRQKLSNLGMRNIVHDMTIEGTSPLALPKQIGRMVAIEDALMDWSEKYPSDRWLPGEMYWFARFLQTKQQAFTDDIAIGYFMYLDERFPNAQIGKKAANSLAQYQETIPFDISEIPAPDPHDNVGDFLFPGLK